MVSVPDITTDDACRPALIDSQIDIGLEVAVVNTTPQITIITPGVNTGEDTAAIGQLRQVITAAVGQNGPTIVQETIYGTGEASFFNTFSPALVGFVVFFLVFILTGISFLRERIGGTLERLLATPVRRLEIVLGYSVGFTFFATLQVALVLLFLLGSLHIEPRPAARHQPGPGRAHRGLTAAGLRDHASARAVRGEPGHLPVDVRTDRVPDPPVHPAGHRSPGAAGGDLLAGRFAARNTGADRPRDADDLRHRGLREVLIKGSGLAEPAVELDVSSSVGSLFCWWSRRR